MEHKTIIIENIIFLICDNITQNADCPYCFKNIYNNYLTYIPLHLNDCHFYLKPSKLQIFNNHFEINDLIHERVQISDKTFIMMREFITLFPSFMIIYTESEHHRFVAGLIDSTILQQDASIYLEDIYLVDWYITTFLIKDYNFENIIFITVNTKNLYTQSHIL